MVFAAFGLTLSLLLLSPSGLYANKASTVVLEVRGERLTLRANDAPLVVILTQLAKAAGITVHLTEPIQERVSIELTDVGLEEGMRRLLKHWNMLFLYAKSPGLPSSVYVLGLRHGAIAPQISPLVEAPVVASEPTEDGEIDVEAEQLKTNLKIGELEEALRAYPEAGSSESSFLLQDLMADPEQSVRITALQWFTGKGDAGIDALVTALSDGNDLVQRVAMQLILDRGIGEEAVKEVMAAAEDDNEKAVRQMLRALLTQQ